VLVPLSTRHIEFDAADVSSGPTEIQVFCDGPDNRTTLHWTQVLANVCSFSEFRFIVATLVINRFPNRSCG